MSTPRRSPARAEAAGAPEEYDTVVERPPEEAPLTRAVRRAVLLAERATAQRLRSQRGVTVRQLPVAPRPRRGRGAEPPVPGSER